MTEGQGAWATRLAALGLLIAIGAYAGWRATRTQPDHRIPAVEAEPWMADALPGIGPKTRDAAAAAIREGRLEDLPKQARAVAKQVFDFTANSDREDNPD